ncbi:MAG: MMPL family transporter [Wenzhouxiangellaceae bacterium]
MDRNTIIKLAVNHPWWVIVFCTLLFLSLAGGLGRLSFSNDYRDYFSDENPQLQAWEQLQQVFSKLDNVFIVATAKEGDLFTPGKLQALAELTEAAETIPYATRIISITNFQHVMPVGADDINVSDLLREGDQVSAEDVAKVKAVATTHVSLVNRLINAEGTTSGVNIDVHLSEQPREQIAEISQRAYAIKAEFSERYPDMSFHITGSVPYNYGLTEATKQDLGSLMPLMYLLILVLFGLITRSILSSVAALVLIVFAIISTMGASGWGGIVLMAPSMSAPTIVMTMVISNAVHLVLSFFRYYREGSDKKQAIETMLTVNWSPILITNFTTAIGFLTLNFSDVPPYRDLGNMVAAGLVLVVFLSLVLLPALLRILPLRPRQGDPRPSRFFTVLGDLVTRRYQLLSVVFLAVLALSGYGISRLELDDQFIEWLDERFEFRTDSDHVNQELTGLYRLDWELESGSEGGIFTPEYLNALSELTDWARQQRGVVHVLSLSDTFKELNQKLHSGNPEYYRVPEDADLAAQLFLVYELSLPIGMDLNNQANVSRSSTRFRMSTSNLTTQELLDLETRTIEWMKANAPPAMVREAASTSILFAKIAKRNIRSLLTGTVFALFFISLLLVVPFRSLKLGLLSLVPNLLPAAIGFGVWGLLVSQVGLAISIVIGVTMGIVVDDTVHFMTWYLRNRREGKSAAEAIRGTFDKVGPALTGTTILLIAGFATLAQSGFEINNQMGALTAIVIGIAYLTDILLLPSLLMMFDRSPRVATD